MANNKNNQHVVIIGGNFAGLAAASKLNKNQKVTVIDTSNQFQWTPNIHEILSDVKQHDSVNLDLPTIVERLGHKFIQQTVVKIDSSSQTLTLQNAQQIEYDVLLIASGHQRANHAVKGADKHAFSFRTSDDVSCISEAISQRLDVKNESFNINIIGGGFTGVEILGELLRKYAQNQQIHINVIDGDTRLVANLPHALSNDIVSTCESHEVQFYFNAQVSEITDSTVYLEHTGIPSDVTIWSAGTALPDYLQSAGLSTASNGIVVNTSLQTNQFDNIFVAGDTATFTQPLAKQAGMAIDMGLHAGKNIVRYCHGLRLKPFRPIAKPILLSLGDINTYFVQGKLVLASPLLAAAKEAVYQLYMARISAFLPAEQTLLGLVNRISLSAEKLLLAEVLKARPKVLLGKTKIL